MGVTGRMLDVSPASLAQLAEEAARAAGGVHRSFAQHGFSVGTKSGHHDLVTEADIEAERVVVDLVRARFPEHNILAEEGSEPDRSSEYTWVVDPLDGTNNYARGIPLFTSSVAVARNGAVVAAAVYDPSRDELFRAHRGGGAFVNGMSMQVRESTELADAILATGFYYDRGRAMEQTLETIRAFFDRGGIGIRRTGSAALDLCYVAAGRYDGFWEHNLGLWDYAGGSLILEEAGGRLTDKQGEPLPFAPSYIVASNGTLHDQLLELVRSIDT